LGYQTMIGLKRHTVKLVEHKSEWKDLAVEKCQKIQRFCAHFIIDVQHVGSTAIIDLPAKPILDIAIAVNASILSSQLLQKLTELGYVYRGNGGDEGGYLFIKESSPEFRTVHMHIVEHNGNQWNNYLLFRDALCKNATFREDYAVLKQKLARKFLNDRKSYTAGKHDFIEKLLKKIAQQKAATTSGASDFLKVLGF